MATKRSAAGVFPPMNESQRIAQLEQELEQVRKESADAITEAASINRLLIADFEALKAEHAALRAQVSTTESGGEPATAAQAPAGHFIQPAIAGYRQLSESDARWINRVKGVARQARELVEDMSRIQAFQGEDLPAGALQVRIGCMLLVRAIARPSEW